METYTKIDTLYKRYQFDSKDCPNKDWLKFKNKIILGEFSFKEAEYLFNCLWEAYSKIDGTNSKIAFFPSTGEIRVEGKTEKAQSQHGQFEMLQEIGERIKPQLCAMFPKENFSSKRPLQSRKTRASAACRSWATTPARSTGISEAATQRPLCSSRIS